MAFPSYKSPASTQGLRNRITELEREVESLKAQLVEARSNTGEAKANAKLLQEYAAYKEHIRRCVADFDAGVQQIHKEAIAECAKQGIKL